MHTDTGLIAGAARIDRINYSAKFSRHETHGDTLSCNACCHAVERGRTRWSRIPEPLTRAISSLGRNRPDAPLCHGVLHLGCGAYGGASFQRRPLLGLMHRVHSFLCARYVPLQPATEHYTAYRIQRHGCMRNLRDSTSNIAHLSTVRHTPRYHFSYTIPLRLFEFRGETFRRDTRLHPISQIIPVIRLFNLICN